VPATILPSQSVSYTVAFTPSSAGNDSATLSVTSNASDPSEVVSLSGAGVSASSSSPPTSEQHSVHLTWNPSASQVIGYLVYRSETAAGNFSPLFGTAITAEAYVDSTVTAGTTYYYVVTAVDSAGAQSNYSNQVTAVIP
jgi:fibronectin type 3 domain-containing protein